LVLPLLDCRSLCPSASTRTQQEAGWGQGSGKGKGIGISNGKKGFFVLLPSLRSARQSLICFVFCALRCPQNENGNWFSWFLAVLDQQ